MVQGASHHPQLAVLFLLRIFQRYLDAFISELPIVIC